MRPSFFPTSTIMTPRQRRCTRQCRTPALQRSQCGVLSFCSFCVVRRNGTLLRCDPVRESGF
jgi:hypothetical protein